MLYLNMLSIYNCTVQDLPVIRELTMQVWPQTYTPILGDEQVAYMLYKFYTPEALTDQIVLQKHNFIVCYEDDEPAGFASFAQLEPGIFKLHKLYVLPEVQGMGVGRFMLDYIVYAIKDESATTLQLNVNIHNDQAIKFYQKVGFSMYKEEDIDIGRGYFMNDFVLRLPV